MTDNASRKRQADGYNADFDIDLAYGKQGELIVVDIAEAISTGQVEVKRDARWHDTGNLYVEYECRRATGWQKSGIATTDALLWAFVLGDTETALVIPTELLKQLARELYTKDAWYRVEQRYGSHPTRGIKIPIIELTSWLALRQKHINRGVA